ncbi:efflux RND transporter permease subunit [Aliarcobacter butzleri]|uniref:efflux RND transporter permease subunit n=1 Tax=Aliarcobacter butzleri TaxID=28197 RepID=UPI0024DE5C1C|nr:efflux RND transporter permease subunit [Aliarcobacter butzleri]MDK2084181.1 efflux RND transporter permease subunit [Aliarcobacter butzleri]
MYKLIDYFYRNSQLNHTILVFFLILGIFSYINIPKEVFPTTQLEKLDIEGSYSGASAESLNNFAVSEIENQLNSISGLEKSLHIFIQVFFQSILNFKKKEELTSIELEKVYDSSIETIKQFENRINLALNDIKLYEELLELNQEEFNAGFKADEDVQTLKNSKGIRKLDIEKYKLNIKKELLYIYFQTI